MIPPVWSVYLSAARSQDAWPWATPALHPNTGLLFVAADTGDLLAIKTDNGEVAWDDSIGDNCSGRMHVGSRDGFFYEMGS
jgi:hypothetical protein